MKTIEHQFDVRIKFEFWAYKNKKLNKKAVSQVKKYIMDTLKNDYLPPIYVEQDDSGAAIEDNVRKISYKKLKSNNHV